MKSKNPMNVALIMAEKGALMGEVPIGAVLVHEGEILAQAHNLTKTGCDPTAHAEMLVLREAAQKIGASRLVDAELYVTLEPCPMCAQAISFARVKKVVFGAYDPKGGGVDHGPRIFESSSCFHRPEVVGGILEKECGDLLQSFFKERR